MSDKKRFSREERANLAHALDHLEANPIADESNKIGGGWYCGNREQFIERHKRAIDMLQNWLRRINANSESA